MPPITWSIQNWAHELDDFDPPDEHGYLLSVFEDKPLEEGASEAAKSQVRSYNDRNAFVRSQFFVTDPGSDLPRMLLFDDPARSAGIKGKKLAQVRKRV